jgi:hypothetical protein
MPLHDKRLCPQQINDTDKNLLKQSTKHSIKDSKINGQAQNQMILIIIQFVEGIR